MGSLTSSVAAWPLSPSVAAEFTASSIRFRPRTFASCFSSRLLSPGTLSKEGPLAPLCMACSKASTRCAIVFFRSMPCVLKRSPMSWKNLGRKVMCSSSERKASSRALRSADTELLMLSRKSRVCLVSSSTFLAELVCASRTWCTSWQRCWSRLVHFLERTSNSLSTCVFCAVIWSCISSLRASRTATSLSSWPCSPVDSDSRRCFATSAWSCMCARIFDQDAVSLCSTSSVNAARDALSLSTLAATSASRASRWVC
mmetsp:Transcript_109446/g.309648  ORF Transcript_109446/g.309648 Transcript_109446/m.309648 type:complete len:257 (-) Transcript_109446:915-1685(-)